MTSDSVSSFTYALEGAAGSEPNPRALVVTADFKSNPEANWQSLTLAGDSSAWLAAVHPLKKTLLWGPWSSKPELKLPTTDRTIPSLDDLVRLGYLHEQSATEKLQRRADSGGLTVAAKTLTGKTITLQHVNPQWTVRQLQAALEGAAGIPQEGIRLISAGKMLTVDQSLQDQGIATGLCTIHVVTRMRMAFPPKSWFVGPRPLSIGMPCDKKIARVTVQSYDVHEHRDKRTPEQYFAGSRLRVFQLLPVWSRAKAAQGAAETKALVAAVEAACADDKHAFYTLLGSHSLVDLILQYACPAEVEVPGTVTTTTSNVFNASHMLEFRPRDDLPAGACFRALFEAGPEQFKDAKAPVEGASEKKREPQEEWRDYLLETLPRLLLSSESDVETSLGGHPPPIPLLDSSPLSWFFYTK